MTLFYLYLRMLNKKLLSLFFLFFGIFNGLSDNPKVIDTLEIHKQIKLFGINEEVLNFKTRTISVPSKVTMARLHNFDVSEPWKRTPT